MFMQIVCSQVLLLCYENIIHACEPLICDILTTLKVCECAGTAHHIYYGPTPKVEAEVTIVS